MKAALLPFVIALFASTVLSHGVSVTWELRGDSVHVAGSFDDGQPMGNAQVTVFSGAAPSEPYLNGVTDGNGEFSFLPDKEESENWDIQLRKAGHGDIVHISLSNANTPVMRGGHGRFSVLQIVLMALCVVWGFIGTALFFASKRDKQNAHT